MKADVVVDLQFGSTGKGMLCGWLSMQNNYDVVVSANMPNAGHTAYDEFGQKWVHKVLPSGIFSEDLKYVGVGAGAIFSIDRLEEEWKQLCERIEDGPTLIIHEAAGILLPEHKEAEQVALTQISSTMQGSGAALCDKVMRKFGVIAAHHRKEIMERLNQYGRVNILNSAQWAGAMGRAKRVLVEGSQGYSLGISAGFYPYCTSRDCTPARVMADCGVPIQCLETTYGTARTYPIRVGSVQGGYSGDWYDDQVETSWEELGVEPETTTVTGRIRRVASFSENQIFEAMSYARPNVVFLNFCNYGAVDSAVYSINTGALALRLFGFKIIYGYGPLPSDMEMVIRRRVEEQNEN